MARKGWGGPRYPIDTTDIWGRRVICFWDVWEAKIVPKHAEMASHNWHAAAVRAISSPFVVTKEPDHKRRNCFYGVGPWWPSEQWIVKVVVEDAR